MTTTDQLLAESNKAYHAFKEYLAMGPQRSLKRVALKLRVNQTQVMQWSQKYRWQNRLLQANRDENEIERKAKEQAALEHARERERRKAQVEEEAWENYNLLMTQVRIMLKTPPTKVEEFEDEKGRHVVMHPHKWDFAAAVRAVQVADQVGRMACGMPVTRQEINGANGRPLSAPVQPIINVVIREDANSREALKRF
jgi:hypothetical protein